VISRNTTYTLAELYQTLFTSSKWDSYRRQSTFQLKAIELHDLLFRYNHEAWTLSIVSGKNMNYLYVSISSRGLQDFIMQLHTGQAVGRDDWNWEQRAAYGQQLCLKLAADLLVGLENSEIRIPSGEEADVSRLVKRLISQLELDGCIFRDGALYPTEATVLDVDQEIGIIGKLVSDTGIANKKVIDHHLELSGTHYADGRWDDSIGNTRKFLEAVLQEIAAMHYSSANNTSIPEKVYKWPIEVRKYLENAGLLTHDEAMSIAQVYGLLSGTGNHPYIAIHDQARLLRNLGLSLAEFVLLRYMGYLQSKTP
jgi:hypothetical protein